MKLYRKLHAKWRTMLDTPFCGRNKSPESERQEHGLHKRRWGLYRLTEEEFNRLQDQQGFACAICRRVPETPSGEARPLYVDHKHPKGRSKTKRGLIRGLLCHNCNLIIGHADDSIERLQRAIQYLLDTQSGAPIKSNESLKHEGIRVRPFTKQ